MDYLQRCIGTALLALSFIAPLQATVTNITSGGPLHATITAALAAALAGDSLLITTGTYNESPDISKNISLQGGYDAAFTTTIASAYSMITNGGADGSVIDITGGAQVQMHALQLQGGHLGYNGGGLDVRSGSTAIVVNCALTQCRGLAGGALYAAGAGTLVLLSNTPILSSSAMTTGGGAQVNDLAQVTASGVNTDINNNYAPEGGGVAIDHARFELTGVAEIYNNTASTRGGGIMAVNGATFVAKDSLTEVGYKAGFVNQVTNGNGGGIYAENAEVQVLDHAIVTGNEARGSGNEYKGSGGGIYVSNSTLLVDHAYIGYNINGSTNCADCFGGGIYAQDARVFLTNGTRIVRGIATIGGGLYMSGGALDVCDTHFGDPLAALANIAYSGGGGFYVENTSARFANTTIQQNQSMFMYGGGYWDGATLLITNTVVLRNTALACGGLLLSPYNAATLIATHIISNTASWNIGGIFFYGGQTTLTDCQIRDNTASIVGGIDSGIAGGMCIADAQVFFQAATQPSEISGNRAAAGGGAYMLGAGTLALESLSAATPVVIGNNVATGHGGGLALYNAATVTAYGAVLIVSNTAQEGGGILLSNAAVLVTRPTNGVAPEILANVARGSGGGVAALGPADLVDMRNPAIGFNRAHGSTFNDGGGGVCARNDATVRLINARVFDNIVSNVGGGIWATAGADLLVDSDFSNAPPALVPPSQIRGNHAMAQGGGVYVINGARGIIKNAMIVSNTANGAVGGLAILYATTAQVVNTVIAHNTGGALVDGVAFQSTLLASMQQCTIVDNNSNGYWNDNTTPTVLENTIIWGHVLSQIADATAASAVSFCDVQHGYPGTSNITNEPDFVNRAGLDYQLQPASPCIDHGTALVWVVNDCIGNPRPYDGGWDIGAYEFIPEPAALGLLLCAAALLRHRPGTQV